MEDPKVSICMVTYNHERYIAQAVESVLMQQTEHSYEIVIGEDCSTDRTAAILIDFAGRHPERIKLRLARRNKGAKKNFIETFTDCSGAYVVILEGDDYWTSPHKLQRQVDALNARPDWAICFHPAACLYEDGASGPSLLPENWKKREATLTDLFASNFMPTSGAMFRNRLCWPLPAWFAESNLGDWPLHILNAEHGNIGFLPEPMSVYRIHSQGIWSSQNLAAKLTSVFKMLTAVDHHFGGKYRHEIDANRLQTVQWLASDLCRPSPSIPTTGSDAWEAVYYQMLDDAQRLRARLDELTHSLPYRVIREIMRPWIQLFSLTRQMRAAHKTKRRERIAPPRSRAA